STVMPPFYAGFACHSNRSSAPALWPERSATIAPMTTLRIANGRVIDPSQAIDQAVDLWIENDRVIDVGPHPHLKADRTIDATGLIVTPGWIDMHVHLREPGREEDETIATGA